MKTPATLVHPEILLYERLTNGTYQLNGAEFVWAWKENPNGLFADFHPSVFCSDRTRKEYVPSNEKTSP
jgi:hypothetical protein